jgi:hypothetical protein
MVLNLKKNKTKIWLVLPKLVRNQSVYIKTSTVAANESNGRRGPGSGVIKNYVVEMSAEKENGNVSLFSPFYQDPILRS